MYCVCNALLNIIKIYIINNNIIFKLLLIDIIINNVIILTEYQQGSIYSSKIIVYNLA
jgi:hypothetical protein